MFTLITRVPYCCKPRMFFMMHNSFSLPRLRPFAKERKENNPQKSINSHDLTTLDQRKFTKLCLKNLFTKITRISRLDQQNNIRLVVDLCSYRALVSDGSNVIFVNLRHVSYNFIYTVMYHIITYKIIYCSEKWTSDLKETNTFRVTTFKLVVGLRTLPTYLSSFTFPPKFLIFLFTDFNSEAN